MIIHRTIQRPGVIVITDLGHQYMYNINYLCTKYYKDSSKDVKNTCVKDGRHLFITWLYVFIQVALVMLEWSLALLLLV